MCEYFKRIRHIVLGYPDGAHGANGARIYNNCCLASEMCFTGKHWIAGDSTYKNTENVVTSYRGSRLDYSEKKKFKLYFCKYRSTVEHCFRKWKETF